MSKYHFRMIMMMLSLLALLASEDIAVAALFFAFMFAYGVGALCARIKERSK